MPKLSNMLGETGRIEIECPNDEPLVVVYRRNSLTPREQARVSDAMREAHIAESEGRPPGGDVVRCMIQVAAQSWVSWNVKDAGGAVIPIDEEHLLDLPWSSLQIIFAEIGRQMQVDPLSGSGSSNSSSATESSGPRLITTAS